MPPIRKSTKIHQSLFYYFGAIWSLGDLVAEKDPYDT